MLALLSLRRRRGRTYRRKRRGSFGPRSSFLCGGRVRLKWRRLIGRWRRAGRLHGLRIRIHKAATAFWNRWTLPARPPNLALTGIYQVSFVAGRGVYNSRRH